MDLKKHALIEQESKKDKSIVLIVGGKIWTAKEIENIQLELKEAKSVIREIASYGMDSTDKEIADEALRVSRAWVANQSV